VEPTTTDELGIVLESLPDDVLASLEVRDAWRRGLAAERGGLEFMVSDLRRWVPGGVVRVAFLDGDTHLHSSVAEATKQITDACNLTLDFGEQAGGAFRRWTTQDTALAAEIRVSFDMDGFFSLVGTDSTDPTAGPRSGPVGGRAGQRSLNLGGFSARLPQRWQGTVRHEFLHALGFHHAHQNMRGPCESQFRWDDDPGYEPTQDPRGMFVPDPAGRSPGIYTFLAGFPNFWPRAKVDHNLRTEESPDLVVGPFDSESVMLYSFAPFFYKTQPSSCAPTGDHVQLSSGDRRGLSLLYPDTREAIEDCVARADAALSALGGGLESTGDSGSPYRDRAIALFEARAGAGAGAVPQLTPPVP
jgi:hypothetical protein